MRWKHLPKLTMIVLFALLVFPTVTLLSCSSEAQLEQQRKQTQRIIEALKQGSNTMVGKWRDEDSVVEFFPDGSVALLHDDGKGDDVEEISGVWTIAGDVLQMTFGDKATINAKILEISPTRYSIKYPRSGVTYNGKRIN